MAGNRTGTIAVCIGLLLTLSAALAIEPPPPPTGLVASEGLYSNQVTLVWDPVRGEDVYYEIYRWNGVQPFNRELIITTPPGVTATNDTTALIGERYVYWVRAVNEAGASAFSEPDRGYPLAQPAGLEVVYRFRLNKDPGWAREGEWEFGKPRGLGGESFGYPDPRRGDKGARVFGVNLSGDYSTTNATPTVLFSLTAGPFDFSNYTDVMLRYSRWLNSDYPPFVENWIQVSTNGVDWIIVWSAEEGIPFLENSWKRVMLSLSPYADRQSTVYVRWVYGLRFQPLPYSGWNIDDIEFLGVPVQDGH